MKIAMVMTVKNEAELLRLNILYHRYAGVERFFVFQDDPTDDSLYSISDLEGVTTFPSVSGDEITAKLRLHPEMAHISSSLSVHHCARQMANSFGALEAARRDGFDWVLSLDPDELVCTNLEGMAPGALHEFSATVPDECATVRFLPLEVAQEGTPTGTMSSSMDRKDWLPSLLFLLAVRLLKPSLHPASPGDRDFLRDDRRIKANSAAHRRKSRPQLRDGQGRNFAGLRPELDCGADNVAPGGGDGQRSLEVAGIGLREKLLHEPRDMSILL